LIKEYSKDSNIKIIIAILKKKLFNFNIIYLCGTKAEFSAPLLQSSMSRDPYADLTDMQICCSRNITFFIISY